jgi:hypothetical protein
MSIRKKLVKAQPGMSVTQGPLEENVQKHLDIRYPGNSIQDIESKKAEESSIRSPMYRSDFNTGMSPANYYSEDNVYKKGGSIIKGSSLRRQVSAKGLRTSRKFK